MTDQKVAPLGDDAIPARTSRGAGTASARHARRSPSAAPEAGDTGGTDRGTPAGSPAGNVSGAVREPAARTPENAPGSGTTAFERDVPANAAFQNPAITQIGLGATSTGYAEPNGYSEPNAGSSFATDATPTIPGAALNAWARAPYEARAAGPDLPSVETRWDTPVIRDREDVQSSGGHVSGESITGGPAANAGTVPLEANGAWAQTPGPRVCPCANCGRPIQQPERGSRTVRYCQDNGGACGEAALRRREQDLDAPGLTGQVAWAWAMVDRLEGMTERIAGSLASELSLAGRERQIAEARAEAHAQAAVTQEERDAARLQADTALRQAALDRSRAEAAERDAAAARAAAERAVSERDAAFRESARTREAFEQAEAARVAAENERDRVAGREAGLLEALESARSELVDLHARASESEKIIDTRRIEATAARRATEDLRAAVHEAETKRGHAVADRDQIQARLEECEQHKWQLARAVEDLRAAIASATVERDAARGEAERARRRVDALAELTTPRTGIRPRPPVEQEPPTGLHPLNGMHLPPAG